MSTTTTTDTVTPITVETATPGRSGAIVLRFDNGCRMDAERRDCGGWFAFAIFAPNGAPLEVAGRGSMFATPIHNPTTIAACEEAAGR